KDATVATLRQEIVDRAAGADALQTDLASANQRIAELAAAQDERDAAAAGLKQELAASVARTAAQRDEIVQLAAKVGDVETGAAAARAEAERARKQHSLELVATNDLRVKIQ